MGKLGKTKKIVLFWGFTPQTVKCFIGDYVITNRLNRDSAIETGIDKVLLSSTSSKHDEALNCLRGESPKNTKNAEFSMAFPCLEALILTKFLYLATPMANQSYIFSYSAIPIQSWISSKNQKQLDSPRSRGHWWSDAA
jgi:hypothetical protein